METYLTNLNDFIEEALEGNYPRVYYLEEFKDEPFEFEVEVVMEFKDGPMALEKLELREDGTLLGKKDKEDYVMCENVLELIKENGKARGFKTIQKRQGLHSKVTARISASVRTDKGERLWAGVTLPIFEGYLRGQKDKDGVSDADKAREEIEKISNGYMKELKDRLTSRGKSIRKGFVKI